MKNKSTSPTIDISLDGFRKNLLDSGIEARDFARTMVLNPLPDKIVYEIINGVMNEDMLEEGEVLIPDAVFNGSERFELDQVVENLWRDGLVPVWINVSVKNCDESVTVLVLECGGRFSSWHQHMYHVHEGRAPFHVLSPPLPPNWEEKDVKFNLFWRENA